MWKIINPYKMAVAVRDNKVSQREFAIYISIFVFLSVVGVVIPLFTASVYEKLLIIFDFFLSLTIAYMVNVKGDNTHFWYRFIGMQISIGIMLVLLSVVVGGFLYPILPSPPGNSILVGVWIIALSNTLLFKYMRIASESSKEKIH